MKIAMFTLTFLPDIGGAEIVIHSLALNLSKLGNNITVYAPPLRIKNFDDSVFPYRIKRIPRWIYLIHRNFPLLGKFFYSNYLNREQKANKFDLWHPHFIYPSGELVRYIKGVQKIATCHGEDIQKSKEINYGYRLDQKKERIIKDTLKRYKYLIAISNSVKEEYHKLGINDKNIIEIPNGINFNRFRGKSGNQKFRKRFKIDRRKFLILTMGRNHPKKGFDRIPRIAKELQNIENNFLWIIVGKGVSKLKQLIDKEGVGGSLLLKEEIGFSKKDNQYDLPDKEMIQFYKEADLFFFPSRIETFGLVTLEAMASGLPVLVSDVPGNNDIVKEGINGCLFSLKNSDKEIARKIYFLIKNSSLREKISKNALVSAKKYDWGLIAKKHEDLYKKIYWEDRSKIGVS